MNLHRAAMPAGDTLWFSSVLKVSGLGSAPVTIHVGHASVTSSRFSEALPDAAVTFSPSATHATTTFDAAHNTWLTTVPSKIAGNVFLDGVAVPVPARSGKGPLSVTWSADFTTDTPGVKVQWQWEAAAYTRFGSDPNSLGVKPTDSKTASAYANQDNAGTPEAYKAWLKGNGNNYTGLSSTNRSVKPSKWVPAPAPSGTSLSGAAFLDSDGNGAYDNGESGMGGITVTLTGTDQNGKAVSVTTTTADDGTYSFQGLLPGTYTLSVQPPRGSYAAEQAGVGTVNGQTNGSAQGASVGGIVLGAGGSGVNYNFGMVLLS
jgi:hypothetical protein